jgi:hypothetical protein
VRGVSSNLLAVKRFLALIGALGATSCTELSARWNDHRVFFGTVRDSATGITLTEFCADASNEHADTVVFSAPAGTTVIDEAFVEGRTEKYFGDLPPERDAAYWCSDAAVVYLHPVNPWICLRAPDDDPPASVLTVEPRGEIAASGSSSGYALELAVQHPGVLRVVFDEQCLTDHAFPISDAGAPIPWGEATIH